MLPQFDNWVLTSTRPAACADPAELNATAHHWHPANVPGTAAQALSSAGRWSLTQPDIDFDQPDWWYQTAFSCDLQQMDTSTRLCFEGLATLAQVWLNDELILESDNMFLMYELDVLSKLKAQNTLTLCFRSMNTALAGKKARPRWKTKLVKQQQLRWFRTTLLGRIPGWTPPVAPVGPFRPVYFTTAAAPTALNHSLHTRLEQGVGKISFECSLATSAEQATLVVGSQRFALTAMASDGMVKVSGQFDVPDVTPWWPHTHGAPCLYPVTLEITRSGAVTQHSLASIGFRTIELDQTDNNFVFLLNSKPVFMRGACWTVGDISSLQNEPDSLRHTLTLMRDAGANMIRIGGTMLYEDELFFDLCDELGILVWQDFMFANMDYPAEDETFVKHVESELTQQVTRLRKHPSIAVYCGNSEIEQQAAMLGMPSDSWRNALFADVIPAVLSRLQPELPYVASSPSGGVLPFHVQTGVTHYYGVGAYQRPINEARRHNVKFTSECLGFANVPVAATRNQVLDGDSPVTHDPRWKARTPRDSSAGWDFEDIRDFYLKELFQLDPVNLRCFDPDYYIRLSEVVSGEVMSQVFAEWRSQYSHCHGGLVWFLKDLWPGAGWGIIDSNNQPKAAYYALKRAWQPVAVHLTDESLDGVHIHLSNESTADFQGKLALSLYTENSVAIAQHEINVTIASGGRQLIESDRLLGGFYDVMYAYRFGPPKHSYVVAQLLNSDNKLVNQSCLLPNRKAPAVSAQVKLVAQAVKQSEHEYRMTLESDTFLYAVNIDMPGFLPDNNFFHLAPGQTVTIPLVQIKPDIKRIKAFVSALNMADEVRVNIISS